MSTEKPDLRKMFKRYCWRYEESWPDETLSKDLERFFVEIVCKRGFVSLYDDKTLHAVYEGKRKEVREKLHKINGAEILENEVETLVLAPISSARKVFSVLKPYLNEEEKRKIVLRLHGK